MYIDIYIGSTLRASLYFGIHTCIWAIYAQSKPCIYIYGSHKYFFCLHLVVNMHYVLCIYHFGMLQAFVLHHYSPQRGEPPSTPCRKIAQVPRYKVDQALQHDLDIFYALSEVLLFIYMVIYACKRLVFAPNCPKYDPIVLNKCAQYCQLRKNNTPTSVVVSAMRAQNSLYGSCATMSHCK